MPFLNTNTSARLLMELHPDISVVQALGRAICCLEEGNVQVATSWARVAEITARRSSAPPSAPGDCAKA